MKMYLRLLKEMKKEIFLNSSAILIFGIVFKLYRLPFEAYIYASSLYGIICMIVFSKVIYQRKKKHVYLSTMNPLEDKLFQETSSIDYDYHQLLLKLKQAYDDISLKHTQKEEDLIQYYTIWVHQIKTPISAMKLMLSHEISEEAEQLKVCLFQIEQYVETVLTYIHLSNNASDYVFCSHQLDPIIKSVIHKYTPLFIHKKLTFPYQPCDLEVITDEKWISFVLGQIIENAIKYTFHGGVMICIENEMLCIKDSGIGINAQDIPRVFEKGFTGNNGRMNKTATGIGLYLCAQIMKNLSHEIYITSKVGVGTCVYLDLLQKKKTNNFVRNLIYM